jgi:UDP-3-O-[3-hydroxymyristoyl] glucosamine N-acyltransferase
MSTRGSTLLASEVASSLGLDVTGVGGIQIISPEPLTEAPPGSMTWTKSLEGRQAGALRRLTGCMLFHPRPKSAEDEACLAELGRTNALVACDAPRLDFARALARFFGHLELRIAAGIDPTARIHPDATIGRDVAIGAFAYVGAGAVIGDGSVLHPHAVVHGGTTVGRNCVLKSHSVVGNSGFGFVRDADGTLVAFPQVGRAVLEDDVQVGCGSMVDRPGLGETRLLRGTKLDNLVHISHGAKVGPGAVVTACAEVGAGVIVGENAWIGPNTCSIEGVTFGAGSFTGIGSTVIRDVAPASVVAGNPAETTEVLRKTRKAIRKLVDSEG